MQTVHTEEKKQKGSKKERRIKRNKTLRARTLYLQICFPLAVAFASVCLRFVVFVNHGYLTTSLKLLNYQQPIP